MQKRLTCFLFILLAHAECTFAQNIGKNNNENSYTDSAIYYFQKCQTEKRIDTVVFEKAIGMLGQIRLNELSINQVEKISRDFRKHNKEWFSDNINEALLTKITLSDSIDLAIRYCKNIINNYDVSRNPGDKFTALFALVAIRNPLRIKNTAEALDYWASRIKIYLEKNDSSALSISYYCIGVLYRAIGLPDMAIYNLKKSLSYINRHDTLTNLQINGLYGWMNNKSVLGQVYLDVGDYGSAIEYSSEARDIKINVLRERNVSFLNCNIAYAKLMLNEPDSVNDLLNSSIQLAIDYNDHPSLVRSYQIKGQYFLARNQLDSAEASFMKSMEAMHVHHVRHFSAAGIITPNFYIAQVRIRQNRYKEARALLEEEMTQIKDIKKDFLKEQKLLIEVCLHLGDSKAADSTFKKYTELQSLLIAEERKNRSKSYEVEAKIEESENTINDLVSEKRIADITKKYLIGIALLLLTVASVIFNRFRVTRRQKRIIEKEKQKNEELLLNILPAEVAEELKVNGSTKAKHFDEVTVLFTDFKGFTQLSEKLPPTELVAEINECFSAFDHIMEKHGIEKIKTIGDAYMAAGGLPVPNQTHAEDVIKACLDIQQFMMEHKKKKQAAGALFFDIRIGVHTGTVVAGIVGVKKFAYDIWGDTVNTASRMESSGEVGKVNISGSTYELVKDKFTCTFRGKIQAKHKGEIEMYFVEGVSQPGLHNR